MYILYNSAYQKKHMYLVCMNYIMAIVNLDKWNEHRYFIHKFVTTALYECKFNFIIHRKFALQFFYCAITGW